MAPDEIYPEEVNVFKIPHLRMKQIVCEATEQISTTNFQDNRSLYGLLSRFNTIFHELKNHEEVENTCIMGKLQLRLTDDQIAAIVKDIHKHSHVRQILFLIKRGFKNAKRRKTLLNVLNYESKLRKAVDEFEKDFFPHMKHEEEVFQPLLMEHFSYEELKNIKEKVDGLHTAFSKSLPESIIPQISNPELYSSDSSSSDSSLSDSDSNEEKEGLNTKQHKKTITNIESQPKLLSFPPEITLEIFSYLSPKDLCRTAQVCKSWSSVARDGQLWTGLFPSRWIFRNDWRFGLPSDDDDCDCNCKGSFDSFDEDFQLMELRSRFADDDADFDESDGNDDNAEHDERRMVLKSGLQRMLGLVDNLLPYVGQSVQVLSLGCSPVLSNGLVSKMLSKCPNVMNVVMSQTSVTDYGLKGLFAKGGGSRLAVLDLSGCKLITDKTLARLSDSLSQATPYADIEEKNSLTCGCMDIRVLPNTGRHSLQYLSLSGCYHITDQGLGYLSKNGGFPNLKYLDLSGCLNITGQGLLDLVSVCPSLDHSQFFYCDNIYEGPYQDTASGCQNLECTYRVCCRLG